MTKTIDAPDEQAGEIDHDNTPECVIVQSGVDSAFSYRVIKDGSRLAY